MKNSRGGWGRFEHLIYAKTQVKSESLKFLQIFPPNAADVVVVVVVVEASS